MKLHIYRVRNLMDSGKNFAQISLNNDADTPKLHVGIPYTLLDHIISKSFGPASMQPQ